MPKLTLKYLVLVTVSSVIMSIVGYFLSAGSLQAYLAIESFAPWNLAVSYFKIFTISSVDVAKEFPALRPFEPFAPAAQMTQQLTNDYSLTRGTSLFLRPITALIDLLLHVLSDAGPVGFVFAIAELEIGRRLMLKWWTKDDGRGVWFYTIGLPIGTVAFASVAAIPLWFVGWLCLYIQYGVSFGVISGLITGAFRWLTEHTVHPVLHDRLKEGLEDGLKTITKSGVGIDPK